MSEEKDAPALLGALGSEQFMLQSIASSTIGEAGTRSMIYLSTLSGGLVAIGFTSNAEGLLGPLAFTVLPTIWVLGWFTVVRLVDTTIENITVERRMERIRAHYATLGPYASTFFSEEDPLTTGKYGVHYSKWSVLFGMASMIGVVNAVLGGAVTALAVSVGLGASNAIATWAGVLVGILVWVATFAYQRRRVRAVTAEWSRKSPERTSDSPAVTR
ncbi:MULTISPECIES: hypothetical protein [unclassified Leifsonia]|uniref:hypothetical protein n=1 Tax=unclassified Leifsonia TaxID=2663824 RepID=UPI000700E230|nr:MULTISPECIES: hypothetical protein [unclassified Leifsonia]KQX07684.1 hypothetical protein ASC59_08105 [Leifsonia sp. Root1293]KRA11966.1 hypothetical protein ASD61_08105 [Leifsonia sp. Root60]